MKKWSLQSRLILISLISAVVLTALAILFLGPSLVDGKNRSPADQLFSETGPDGKTFHRLVLGPTNLYLLPLDQGWLLVDTSYTEEYPRFVELLRVLNIPLTNLRWVFLTHSHDDHAGFLAQVLKDSGARLIVPASSLENLASGRMVWKGTGINPLIGLAGSLYSAVKNRSLSFPPVIPGDGDIILKNSQAIPSEVGLSGRFLPTPGHSPDSWSLVLEDGRAFCGDAAMNYLQFLGAGYRPIFVDDRAAVYTSWEALKMAGATRLYTGHGEPFPVENLPAYTPETPVHASWSEYWQYVLLLIPALLLGALILGLLPPAARDHRIWVWLVLFVLLRDLMTPLGFWTLGSSPVFWLRFTAEGSILVILGLLSAGLAFLALKLEKSSQLSVQWFGPRPWASLPAGLAAALVITLPWILYQQGILPGERGGLTPTSLWLPILVVALGGNLLEEVLFRGLAYGRLEALGLPGWKAGVLSGLLFALCHVFLAYTVTDVGIGILAFTLWEGILLGLVRWKFGLTAAVLGHGFAIFLLTLGVV